MIRDPTGWEWRGFEDWEQDNRLCLGLDKTRKQEARAIVWSTVLHLFFSSQEIQKKVNRSTGHDDVAALLLAVVAVSLASLLPWLRRDANQSGWQARFARGVLPLLGTSIMKSTSLSCVRVPRSVSRKKSALVR